MAADHVFHWGPNIMFNYYRSWEFGIWIIKLPVEFRMQINTEFREIPRNSGKNLL
jgi:hypothetical protein